jgi:curved DNA-binding protein CbpA
MSVFFKSVKTFVELKNQYRKFAQSLHPDKEGGNAEKFVAMKKEYDILFKKLKNGTVDSDGEKRKHTSMKYDYKDIIDKLIFVEGADIEIVGDWIWVWGIKYTDLKQREQLKEIGLQWGKNKKAWYYSGTKGKWRKGMSKEEMRNTFGVTKIGKGHKPLLDE